MYLVDVRLRICRSDTHDCVDSYSLARMYIVCVKITREHDMCDSTMSWHVACAVRLTGMVANCNNCIKIVSSTPTVVHIFGIGTTDYTAKIYLEMKR